MSDLVEELRAEAFNDTYDVNRDRVTVSSNLLIRAAAEIEVLRANPLIITDPEQLAQALDFRKIKQEIKNGV